MTQPARAKDRGWGWYGLASVRSIAALMLREMSSRYGRTPGGYLWSLLEPLGMIVILGFAWSVIARAPSLGTSFFLFKATGLLTLQMFTNLGGTVGQAMMFSRPLLFYPRVTWIDAILARFLLNALVVTTVMTIILIGIMIYDDVRTVLDWGKIGIAVGLTAALGLGIGCLNCYAFIRFPVWMSIWSIITRPLFLISGVIIIFEDMPAMAQDLLWFNPLIHLTGIMRDGFYPTYSPQYISLAYLGAWIVIPMVMGLLLLRQFNRDLLNRI